MRIISKNGGGGGHVLATGVKMPQQPQQSQRIFMSDTWKGSTWCTREASCRWRPRLVLEAILTMPPPRRGGMNTQDECVHISWRRPTMMMTTMLMISCSSRGKGRAAAAWVSRGPPYHSTWASWNETANVLHATFATGRNAKDYTPVRSLDYLTCVGAILEVAVGPWVWSPAGGIFAISFKVVTQTRLLSDRSAVYMSHAQTFSCFQNLCLPFEKCLLCSQSKSRLRMGDSRARRNSLKLKLLGGESESEACSEPVTRD